jgi:mono/diheme cytochrome c family protein
MGGIGDGDVHIGKRTRLVCAAAGGVVLAAAMVAGASAEDLRARGAYLVNTIAGCGNCHTPKDRAGRAVAGKELSGGLEFDVPPAPNVFD